MSAESKKVVRIAVSPDTTRSCGKVRTSSANATGIDARRTARPRSAQMSTGRRRSRSTQAPATRPKMSAATSSAPRSRATSMAPDPSTRIAANGSANRVISEPKIEIDAAVQTRTKDGLRQRADGERAAHGQAEHSARRRPAVHSRCPVRQNSRTTLGRRPLIPVTTETDGVPPEPCSTPSATACARRSAS